MLDEGALPDDGEGQPASQPWPPGWQHATTGQHRANFAAHVGPLRNAKFAEGELRHYVRTNAEKN